MCRKQTTSWALLVCVGLAASGCVPSLGQKKARQERRQTPESFARGKQAENSAKLRWDAFFDDPHLRSLIKTALVNNQELNILLQEIEIANNEVLARKGEYQPRVGVRAGLGLEKVGRYTSQGAADEANGVPEHLQDYVSGFVASWEIDVWKRLRNATKAAVYRYLASIEGKNFMTTRLVAEIATVYYELMALDNQLEVVKRNVAIQQNALEVVILQKEAARVTELAVQRFEAEVLRIRSRQYELEQRIVEAENRMNVLVGRYPQSVSRSSQVFVEVAPKYVYEGIPSELLENRPDVTRAELELEAAKLDVEVAKAQFFPSFGMRAGLGFQAFKAHHLLNFPESLTYSVSAELLAPLVNRKAIKALYFSANAQQLQAVFNFERAILNAYAEVANQLSMITNLGKSFELRQKQVEKLNESIDTSTNLFKSARADYMEVLLTRRDALESQMELIETKQRQLLAVVNLYQALGGGWRQE